MKSKIISLAAICLMAFTLMACQQKEEIANPWTDTTLDALESEFGTLPLPEGHTNDVCSILESEGLAQVEFNIADVTETFTFRAQKTDELTDISGLNYDWTAVNEYDVNGYADKECSIVTDEGDVQLIYWYDTDAGMTYSLAISGENLDGLDLYGYALSGY